MKKRNVFLSIFAIHAYAVSMEKLQILFPEPQLRRLRALAQRQDRPVSELIRSAVDLWLSRTDADSDLVREDPPVFHGGPILIPASEMREAAYKDNDLP
jgi:Arc/MetJ-type ribon-helix-helix transcriptional regulator